MYILAKTDGGASQRRNIIKKGFIGEIIFGGRKKTFLNEFLPILGKISISR